MSEWRIYDAANGQFVTVVGFPTRRKAEAQIEQWKDAAQEAGRPDIALNADLRPVLTRIVRLSACDLEFTDR